MGRIKWEKTPKGKPLTPRRKARTGIKWEQPKLAPKGGYPQVAPKPREEDIVERYVDQDDVRPEALHEVFCRNMYQGALWVCAVRLTCDERNPEKRASFPVLRYRWGDESGFEQGQSCVYAGMVEIKQRTHKGVVINIRKHAFMFPDGLYIPEKLSTVMPLSEWEKRCAQSTG